MHTMPRGAPGVPVGSVATLYDEVSAWLGEMSTAGGGGRGCLAKGLFIVLSAEAGRQSKSDGRRSHADCIQAAWQRRMGKIYGAGIAW